jgi:phenylalanyl-tRNA synthetase alpha chain
MMCRGFVHILLQKKEISSALKSVKLCKKMDFMIGFMQQRHLHGKSTEGLGEIKDLSMKSNKDDCTAANVNLASNIRLFGKLYEKDATYNLTSSILSKVLLEEKPLAIESNPIHILNKKIQDYLVRPSSGCQSRFKILETPRNPIVSPKENFDDLLIPKDHCSRLPNDTYYINECEMLRTHTSAHQGMILTNIANAPEFKDGTYNAFCLSADVYRRDEIDKSHYPVFHQMEGIRLFDDKELKEMANTSTCLPNSSSSSSLNSREVLQEAAQILQISNDTNKIQDLHEVSKILMVSHHLKQELEGLIRYYFRKRWKQLSV